MQKGFEQKLSPMSVCKSLPFGIVCVGNQLVAFLYHDGVDQLILLITDAIFVLETLLDMPKVSSQNVITEI